MRYLPWRAPSWMRCVSLAVVVLCASAGASAEEGGTGAFDPGDLGQAIMSLVIFAVLLLVLRKWAWKPIVAQLRSREESVAESIERAQRHDEEAQQLLAQYRQQMSNVEMESRRVLDRARKEADEARREILDAAREEARLIVDKGKREVEEARQAARRQLQETTARLATEIAERVLGGGLDPEVHRKLLEESVSEISRRTEERE